MFVTNTWNMQLKSFYLEYFAGISVFHGIKKPSTLTSCGDDLPAWFDHPTGNFACKEKL